MTSEDLMHRTSQDKRCTVHLAKATKERNIHTQIELQETRKLQWYKKDQKRDYIEYIVQQCSFFSKFGLKVRKITKPTTDWQRQALCPSNCETRDLPETAQNPAQRIRGWTTADFRLLRKVPRAWYGNEPQKAEGSSKNHRHDQGTLW